MNLVTPQRNKKPRKRSGYDHLTAQLARLILGGFFVYSALDNLLNLFITAERLNVAGSVLLVLFGALFKFIFGVALALRFHTRYVSMALVIYLTFMSFIFYGPHLWTEENLFKFIFTRNLAIIGGLLFVYAHSRSFDKWQEEWIPEKQRKMIEDAHKEPPHPQD